MADPHPTGLLGSGQELNMIDFNLSLIDWKEGAGGPWAGEGHELTCLFQRSPCCCERARVWEWEWEQEQKQGGQRERVWCGCRPSRVLAASGRG